MSVFKLKKLNVNINLIIYKVNKEFDNVCQNKEYKSMTIYGGTNI